MNILESYKGRLAVAESFYAKSHNNEKMSNQKKLVTAKMLENTNKFLNEAFDNSVGTQRADMGAYRKFALNLTTVAVPNLIAFDLVFTYPMSSISGYVTYVEYVAGSNKGGIKRGEMDADGNFTGDVFNSPLGLGKVDPDYTGEKVVETLGESLKLMWTPVAKIVKAMDADGNALDITGWKVAEDGTLSGSTDIKAGIKVAYLYDNVIIAQNDLPILNARVRNIPLVAKARRIAIFYSQMAAFQAKNDYGFDMGDELAAKAVGQLSYEIDTEICNGLIGAAPSDSDLVWSKTLPIGVSKQEHYAGFVEILEIAAQKIFDRTKRFSPNYMLISSSIRPILAFVPGFEAAPKGNVNGPHFIGTLNGLKVYVTPNIEEGKFVIGVNGDDASSSAAVFAPYMPIVPTQLLNYADGSNSQGWSTMYAFEILNDKLLVSGKCVA